jgi:hypothetical protein
LVQGEQNVNRAWMADWLVYWDAFRQMPRILQNTIIILFRKMCTFQFPFSNKLS